MQDQVAEPLEKRLQELRWYDRTETFTRPGLAFTTLILLDKTPPSQVQSEFYQARKKLEDEAPKLPRGVAGPFVNDEYGDVTFALYALKAKGVPQRQLAREAEALRQRLLHGGEVFAFAGPSGSGKSTLIAALGQLGLPMFCDDTLVLDLGEPDIVICLPGHKRLKLTPEAL